MSVKAAVQELVQSPKAAGTVSAITTTTGLGTVLDYIPDDIGKLATLVGIVLSVILIRIHLIGLKKIKVELNILQMKQAEQAEAAAKRKAQGQPLRRSVDD